MKKIGDFFKRIRVKQEETKPIEKKNDNSEIQIKIEGDINLFEGEKEKIIEGAKQLLEIGKAKDMEEAIVAVAVIIRGLKFVESKNKDGKTVIVFSETARKISEKDTNNVDSRDEK